MTQLPQYIDLLHKACLLAYGSFQNKFLIAQERERAATDKQVELVWADVKVRAAWGAKFQRQDALPRFEAAYKSLNLPVPTTSLKQIRIDTPVSFTQEPCDLCKTLEVSFTPNDQEQRTQTVPWEDQYIKIFESVVADTYKQMAASRWIYAKIDSVREDEPPSSDLTLSIGDATLGIAETYFQYGRGCFVRTELHQSPRFRKWFNQSRHKWADVDLNKKYLASNPVNEYTAAGGLFMLNKELLCPACAANVEDIKIRWSY